MAYSKRYSQRKFSRRVGRVAGAFKTAFGRFGKIRKSSSGRVVKRAPKRSGKKKKTFKKTHKSMILANLMKSIPAQSYVSSYVDTIAVNGTTNAAALQYIWGAQQNSYSTGALGSSVSNTVNVGNMQLTPNLVLSNILAQIPGGDQKTSQLLLRDCSQKCRMTNLSTGTVIITEYRVRARQDCIANLVTGSSSDITDVIVNGFGDATANAGGGDAFFQSPVNLEAYGVTPFMNPRFVAMFKVIKVKKFELGPARSKKFAYKTVKPRIIKQEQFNPGGVPISIATGTAGTTLKQVSKGQSFSVFQAQGTIATSTAATASENTVGVGNISIGMIYETKIHYSVISPTYATSSSSSRIPGFTANQAVFPAPIVQNQPISAVSTGSVPPAAGTRVYAAAGSDPFVIRDAAMVDT